MKTNDPKNLLWYRKGASRWEEALPVGNGRLGAMVWGRVDEEILDLNEDTLWSGFPRDPVNYEAARSLAAVRELLTARRWAEAQSLVESAMLGARCESYQPLGRLTVRSAAAPATDFRRGLDLADGIAFAPGRQVFASAADQVVVVRWDRPGDVEVLVTCPHPHDLSFEGGRDLVLSGRCPSHVADNYRGDHPHPVVYEEGLGMRFAARAAVLSDGGTAHWDQASGVLRVAGASALTVVLTASGNWSGPAEARCRRDLEDALSRSYEVLRRRHLKDHRSLWDRFDLDLGPGPDHLPTDERLEALGRGRLDPALVALYARYGRYLMMACSRPGTEAANLQGIWNPHVSPPWCSDYTTNINTPMNYWPTEAANLADCHEPLFRLLSELEAPGRRVARLHYGCGGWTAHHNVDFWRSAGPSDGDASWAFWPLAGVWLSTHLMEHWRFGRDLSFLRDQAWPLMAGAAEFALDWLVEGPDGTLTTSPSTSPENRWLTADGTPVAVTIGSAMDRSLIRHLLEDLVEAGAVLGNGSPLVVRAAEALPQIPGMHIGTHGRVLEWGDEVPEAEPGHRHFSPLFGLYPGREVGRNDSDLRAACRATILRRLEHGGGHTGWSCAWLINLFARLEDGESAGAAVRKLLVQSTLPNLLDDHPPFQIDGNFGGLAGVLEMLCQSHDGMIRLHPAWPASWGEGRVQGLRARGGFVLDLAWSGGILTRGQVRASVEGACRLVWPQGQAERFLGAGEVWSLSF